MLQLSKRTGEEWLGRKRRVRKMFMIYQNRKESFHGLLLFTFKHHKWLVSFLASWSHTWAELHFGRRRFEPFRTWSKNNFITQTTSLVGVARLHLAPAWGRCVVMYVVSVFHPLRSVKMEVHEKHGSPFSRWSFTQAFRFNVEPLNHKQHSQQGPRPQI